MNQGPSAEDLVSLQRNLAVVTMSEKIHIIRKQIKHRAQHSVQKSCKNQVLTTINSFEYALFLEGEGSFKTSMRVDRAFGNKVKRPWKNHSFKNQEIYDTSHPLPDLGEPNWHKFNYEFGNDGSTITYYVRIRTLTFHYDPEFQTLQYSMRYEVKSDAILEEEEDDEGDEDENADEDDEKICRKVRINVP